MKSSAKSLKEKPATADDLGPETLSAPVGSTTIDRVTHCLALYTHVRPILPEYHVGALCQDIDFLGADLNREFQLIGRQRYWQGEIEGAWTVRDLSGYTDRKAQVKP